MYPCTTCSYILSTCMWPCIHVPLARVSSVLPCTMSPSTTCSCILSTCLWPCIHVPLAHVSSVLACGHVFMYHLLMYPQYLPVAMYSCTTCSCILSTCLWPCIHVHLIMNSHVYGYVRKYTHLSILMYVALHASAYGRASTCTWLCIQVHVNIYLRARGHVSIHMPAGACTKYLDIVLVFPPSYGGTSIRNEFSIWSVQDIQNISANSAFRISAIAGVSLEKLEGTKILAMFHFSHTNANRCRVQEYSAV
jgi:hypothetical protein